MNNKETLTSLVLKMVEGLSKEHIDKVIGTANKYATFKNYPKNKDSWTDKQIDSFLNCVERALEVGVEHEQQDLFSKVSAIMGEVNDITPGIVDAGSIVDKVVEKVEEQNKYREDLTCPWCKSKVYDNRNNKKSERSPDFVCSTNDPAICGGHTGTWRKSWWLNSSDIPEEWGI